MTKSLSKFLQALTVVFGIGIAAFLLWEPHLEGRNVDATLFQIYFQDAFLAYVYVGSVSFFVAIYHVFKVLGYLGNNQAASEVTKKSLRTIKYSAILLALFILGGQGYIFTVMRGKDDIAGGIMMGNLLLLISIVVASIATVFEKRLQKNA
jgi:hypothetical protein